MKKTVLKRVTTLLLIVALCASIAIAIVACDGKKANAPVVDQNGNAIAEGVTTSLPKGIVYTADAVTTAEPVTRTFKATVTPSNATNKELIWSLSWKNASSEWASGKNIGEYLTLSSSGMSATLTCSQAFGEQAIITVRSADNTDIYKNCTIDYSVKIVDFELDFYQDNVLLGTIEKHSELNCNLEDPNSWYNKDNGVLKHNHSPQFSIQHILDSAHSISFQLKPVFSVGTTGNTNLVAEYSAVAGVDITFVNETAYRFHEYKNSATLPVFDNLINGRVRPEYTNTKESPFNPFAKYTIPLGSNDIRQMFFYNGFLASDAQTRDVVNFAKDRCLLKIGYGVIKINGTSYVGWANDFCLGVDTNTLNVAVADVTIDNSQVII